MGFIHSHGRLRCSFLHGNGLEVSAGCKADAGCIHWYRSWGIGVLGKLNILRRIRHSDCQIEQPRQFFKSRKMTSRRCRCVRPEFSLSFQGEIIPLASIISPPASSPLASTVARTLIDFFGRESRTETPMGRIYCENTNFRTVFRNN